jgi:hypothetical protein
LLLEDVVVFMQQMSSSEGVQEQNVQGTSPIDEDSVELDILVGADNQRVLT